MARKSSIGRKGAEAGCAVDVVAKRPASFRCGSTGYGGQVATGAAAEGEAVAVGALEADLGGMPSGARGLIAQRRAQGLILREKVYELHVHQGLPLLQVARTLGISLKLVSYHWCKLQNQIIANSPRSPDDFAVLRERISAMLWQTIQVTCPAPAPSAKDSVIEMRPRRGRKARCEVREAEPMVTPMPVRAEAEGEVNERECASAAAPTQVLAPAPSAPMLAIRLKALEQLARLYDLGLDARTPENVVHPYSTPAEIAQSVRDRILELHERRG